MALGNKSTSGYPPCLLKGRSLKVGGGRHRSYETTIEEARKALVGLTAGWLGKRYEWVMSCSPARQRNTVIRPSSGKFIPEE